MTRTEILRVATAYGEAGDINTFDSLWRQHPVMHEDLLRAYHLGATRRPADIAQRIPERRLALLRPVKAIEAGLMEVSFIDSRPEIDTPLRAIVDVHHEPVRAVVTDANCMSLHSVPYLPMLTYWCRAALATGTVAPVKRDA